MRTNKACPNYSGLMSSQSSNVAMTDDQEEEIEKHNIMSTEDDDELVNIEGTKVKLSSKLIKVSLTNYSYLFLYSVYFSGLPQTSGK